MIYREKLEIFDNYINLLSKSNKISDVNELCKTIMISEKHKPLILFHNYYKSKNNRWKMKLDYKNKNNNNIICMVLESPLSLNIFLDKHLVAIIQPGRGMLLRIIF